MIDLRRIGVIVALTLATSSAAGQAVGRGSIEVVLAAPVDGVVVRVDGGALAPGDLRAERVEAGPHVVDGSAPGHRSVERTVEVSARAAVSVEVALEPLGAPMRIESDTPGARVTIGAETRDAPWIDDAPSIASFDVVVSAEGFVDAAFSCSTDPSAEQGGCARSIALAPIRVPVHVALAPAPRRPATLVVDGEIADGLDASLGRGTHVIEVRAEGYDTYREELVIDGPRAAPIEIAVTLVDPIEEAAAVMMSRAAVPLAETHWAFDASVGWPYLGEVRASVGLLHELLDVGATLRTFGRLTELEARARVGHRVVEIEGVGSIGVGGQLRFGGGVGPSSSVAFPNYTGPDIAHARRQDLVPEPLGAARYERPLANTVSGSVEALATFFLFDVAAFTLTFAADLSSDQYVGHPRNERTYLDFGPGGASNPICMQSGMEIACPGDRQDMGRFRLGLTAEVVVAPFLNLWLVVEGIAAQTPDHRRVLSAVLGTDAPDLRFYPRLGVTLKL